MERRHFLGCVGGIAVAAGTTTTQDAGTTVSKPKETVCKITVVKRSVEQELADRYRNGKVKQCDVFKDGQEFTVTQPWSPPEGFCQWAWADIRAYISANFHGGNLSTVVCCTDGFRPVYFRIERVTPKG